MAGGRPPGPNVLGKPRNSGRKKGSLDLQARKLLTGQMASDILQVYQRLGGVKWLEKLAREQPGEFFRGALSRLFPAPQKDDPDAVINQINVGNLSDIEAASRIAFALAKAGRQLDAPIDADPLVPDPDPVAQTPAPTAATPVPTAAPVADPVARNEAWASLLPPTAAEWDAQAATQQAPDSHHGSAEEQARPRPPRPGLSNRREELL